MDNKILSTVLVLLFFLLSNAFSQVTGKIAGTVIDKDTGEPLIGTNVVIEGTYWGASADSKGEFFIINIPPGVYDVTANMIGYGSVRFEDIRVSVNSTTDLVYELSPEVLEGEVVIVTMERFAVKKDQTSSTRNISSDEMEVLPVEDIDQVVQMQPGVVAGHFRGGRSSESSFMLDGVLITESFNHTSTTVEVTPSAVADMEVITGTFNAEYGNAMSGVVNVVTKEGGNSFSGSGSVNLGNYITANKDIFAGIENTDIRIQDYTFNISGPIWKDRLNFIIDGRYAKNRGHLNGVNYFNVDDYSNYTDGNPENWISYASGDSSYVDMDHSEKLVLFGKLSFKPIKDVKTSFIYTYNQNESQGYNHSEFFKPSDRPTYHNESYMAAFHLNHMLSPKAFYELKLSYNEYTNGSYLYEDPLDSRYISDFYGSSDEFFSTGGQSKGHNMRTEGKLGTKFDLTWQLHNNHSVKFGADLAQFNLDQAANTIMNKYEGTDEEALYTLDSLTNNRIYSYYEPELRSDLSVYSDNYIKEPFQFAVYIQDKMEFQAMVVNAGVRYDYFDPKTVYPTNWRNPANQDLFMDQSRMSDYPDVEPQWSLSPRIGLAYKLGETALLRFSYGHFLQIPALNYFYQNHQFRVTELGQVGNPLLKLQKTVSYETGLWLQLTSSMDIEVAVFYRDIYDLLSSKLVYTYSQIRYGLFDNKDYGNVRGLELRYQFRSGDFSATANYTLQYTRGVADSPDMVFSRAGSDMDPVNKLIPLSWDQRHTLNIMAGYNTEVFGVSLIGFFNSGMPYTWSPLTEDPLSRLNLMPNNQYRPAKFSVDLQGHYNLMTVGGMDVKLTLLVYNLLDRLNEDWVNSATGRAYTAIIRPVDINNYHSDFSELSDAVENPSMYATPRSIKLGLGFTF
ncbi:TonB-dependent receptor domain-containing protein [Candidatus Neomarinimicrobiota bacterium]